MNCKQHNKTTVKNKISRRSGVSQHYNAVFHCFEQTENGQSEAADDLIQAFTLA